MSQHDFDIANQGFAAFRADLNNALKALGSVSSGTEAPTTTYANQLWYETDTNILHIRNEANSAWLDLMVIDQTTGSPSFNAGNVGIGTTAPVSALHLASTAGPFITFQDNDAGANQPSIGTEGTAGSLIYSTGGTSASHIFKLNRGASEAVRIDSSGNVGIGTATPAHALSVARNSSSEIAIQAVNAGVGQATLRLQNSLRHWAIFVDDGASGPLRFYDYTAAAERARIDDSGVFSVGCTALSTTSTTDTGAQLGSSGAGNFFRSGNTPLIVMRQTNDGTLVDLRQGGASEGSISVSGTTVSYNGGHLSRWAQFPDNSRPELLKGTVMSNLDQMSNWDGEENEQLNCVQVSTVEGDANVAGVFVAWDTTEDDYNDILLAMTGDMVIRIGAGVTVARGDLLMSAGDGTAKPQGDDIVRSKTIAKVTSTHVSHTYADGSYAVPCVLMAC
jgi:hypothetical protein